MKLTLRSSLLAGGLALSLVTFGAAQAGQATSGTTQISETAAKVQRELGTFAKLAKRLNPSVVNISVVGRAKASAGMEIPEEFRKMIPPEVWEKHEKSTRPTRGQGSGVLISADGRILTNNHVVDEASEIKVTLFDGREFEAEVVGLDSNTDVALIRLKNASDLPVAQLGDSDVIAVGDWVMAIGNPFGLEATVTVGVLSGKGRVIGAGPYDDFLQTDASINPGNSGGPLFNLAGEVVGINTATLYRGQGIGFAIPINLAKEIATDLADDGKVERGFLGVGMQELSDSLRAALSIPAQASGVLVASVVPDSPAAEAGVKPSDLITSVGGVSVSSSRELLKVVAKIEPGTRSHITVLRDGVESRLNLVVAERPTRVADNPTERPEVNEPMRSQRLGVIVDDSSGSVVVKKVQAQSPAADAGIRPGDKVLSVGRQRVATVAQFRSAVAEADAELALLIERAGRSSFVVIDGE